MEQDPGVFGDPYASVIRRVIEIRYTLLPFLYTLFYLHFSTGGTVARPLWHEFPQNPITRS